jgi:hypothetical protein
MAKSTILYSAGVLVLLGAVSARLTPISEKAPTDQRDAEITTSAPPTSYRGRTYDIRKIGAKTRARMEKARREKAQPERGAEPQSPAVQFPDFAGM